MKRFIFLLVLIFGMGGFILHNKEQKEEILPVSREYIEIQDNDIIVYNSMNLIAKMEELRLTPYRGLGHKEYAICYGNSFKEYKRRFKTNIGTKENCDTMLKEKVEKIFDDIKEDGLYLKDDFQYVALISLAYNLRGNYNAIKGTNLYQHLQYGQDIDGIIGEWFDFSHVKGKVICGLLKRNANAMIVFFGSFPQEQKEYAYVEISHTLHDYNVCKDMNLRIYE
jgi:GH24 family phage-related lysozyme (muramidase)